jgi:hypothetical protein
VSTRIWCSRIFLCEKAGPSTHSLLFSCDWTHRWCIHEREGNLCCQVACGVPHLQASFFLPQTILTSLQHVFLTQTLLLLYSS